MMRVVTAGEARFRDQQPMLGRFRDRLRQSLDRIGLTTRSPRGARAMLWPPRKIIFAPVRENPTPFESQHLNPFFPLSRVKRFVNANKSCPTENRNCEICESESENRNTARTIIPVSSPRKRGPITTMAIVWQVASKEVADTFRSR